MFDDADEVLADLVDRTAQGYEPARRERVAHPKGFEPGVDLRDPTRWVVTTPPMEMLAGEGDWRATVEALVPDIPVGWQVRLVEMRYDPAAWTRDNHGDDAVTRPVWRYRFAVEQTATAGGPGSNLDELVREIKRTKAKVPPKRGDGGTFVVAWNDWQLFKSAGDGIEGTVRRVLDSFEVTLQRVKELRRLGRTYPRLLVAASGDIVEGCAIFPHQSWEVQGDSRDQENAARRLIVAGLKQFAPHFDQIQVLAVGGNHGENRVDGKRINRHDNADCKVFEQAADVFAENPESYGHLLFRVPREDLAATIDIEGWVLGLTHGHIAGKGAGNPEAKIEGWYKGQAAGKKPVGDADVLLTSHFHHARLADWGGCLWMQAPAMDGGSQQHTDLTGKDARSGLLTFGMTREDRMRDYAVTYL